MKTLFNLWLETEGDQKDWVIYGLGEVKWEVWRNRFFSGGLEGKGIKGGIHLRGGEYFM